MSRKIHLKEAIAIEALFAEGLKRATTLRVSIQGEGSKRPSLKSMTREEKINRAVEKRNARLKQAI